TINKAIVPGSGMPEKSSIAISDLTYAEIYLSGPTSNYQRVIANPGNFLTASVRNADGTYTYTLPAIPATYLAPPNDSASFGTTDGEKQGQALEAGTYTIGIAAYKNYTVGTQTVKDVVNYTKNIQLNTAAAEDAREVVKDDNCNRCHATLQVHGGMRRKVALCVLCHVSGGEDKNLTTVDVDGDGDMDADDQTVGASIDFRVMIHKIHNGAHLPSVNGVGVTALGVKDYTVTAEPYNLVGYGNTMHEYSEVAFPVWPSLTTAMPRDLGYSALTSAQKTTEGSLLTGVVACDKCHGDPDGSGSMTAPADQALSRIPSRRACGSCHDDIDWTLPYQSNGMTMAANQADAGCAACHPASNSTAWSATNLPVVETHKHPFVDSAVNPGANLVITEIRKNSAAGADLTTNAAANGDAIWIKLTCKDDAGNNIPLGGLSTVSMACLGPTTNPQPIIPFTSVTGTTVSPFDYAGRQSMASTSNKASMSRVVGATAQETLLVEFTSGTAFNVFGITPATGAVAWGPTAGTALPASTSHSFGVAPSSITLTGAGASGTAQTITIDFSSSTVFTVTGSVSGALGGGTLPNATSASMLFTSTDGSISFIVTAGGSNTYSEGVKDKLYLSLFKGPVANPVIFTIYAGTSTVAAADRIYYDVIPTAADYSLKIPVDIVLEYLGDATAGAHRQCPIRGRDHDGQLPGHRRRPGQHHLRGDRHRRRGRGPRVCPGRLRRCHEQADLVPDAAPVRARPRRHPREADPHLPAGRDDLRLLHA
ncbi:MAG: hypothetical protein HYY93_00510, partial [Planctomycetes bacterium]|nr:hypothetical protein [Planctomycetota bacterium]